MHMASFLSDLKPFRFGTLLYGLPFCLLLVVVLISAHLHLNSVQTSLIYGNSITLFIISTTLGAIVDNYFRSNPKAFILKVLLIGSFVWSFLCVTSIMLVANMAFKTYDTSHHTNFMPPDLSASWPTIIGGVLMSTMLGGVLFLPFNYIFMVLVRRHYQIY